MQTHLEKLRLSLLLKRQCRELECIGSRREKKNNKNNKTNNTKGFYHKAQTNRYTSTATNTSPSYLSLYFHQTKTKTNIFKVSTALEKK